MVTHDIDEALELGTRLVLLKERPAVIREDKEINSDKSNLRSFSMDGGRGIMRPGQFCLSACQCCFRE